MTFTSNSVSTPQPAIVGIGYPSNPCGIENDLGTAASQNITTTNTSDTHAEFRTTFWLPAGYIVPALSLLVKVDDVGRILVNGHQLAEICKAPNGPQLVYAVGTTDASFFVTGTNTLTFQVVNNYINCDFAEVSRGGPGDGMNIEFEGDVTFDYPPEAWTMKASLPIPNRNMGGAVLGTNIYILGGDPTGCGFTNRAFRYDVQADTWIEIAGMGQAKNGLGCGAWGHHVYAIAGNTACGPVPTDAMERLDVLTVTGPGTGTWENVAPLPQGPREQVSSAEVNQFLYAFKGQDARRYVPAIDEWQLANSSLADIDGRETVAVGGKVYAIEPGGPVQIYNTANDTWSTGATMPVCRSRFAVAAIGQVIYVVGGNQCNPDQEVYPTSVLAYNTAGDRWAECPTTGFTGRYGLVALAVGNTVYAIGGVRGLASPIQIFDNVEATTFSGAPYCGLVAVQNPGSPGQVQELVPPRPNPFGLQTTIPFALQAPGKVELRMYDVAGRMVRQLVRGELGAGRHDVVWDGRDESGASLRSGAYFYKLTVNGKVVGSEKAVFLGR